MNNRLDVVGESRRYDAISKILGEVNGDGVEREDVSGYLKAEPSNTADKNAVAVYVDDLKVGYLSRQDNAVYSRKLRGGFLRPPRDAHILARVWGARKQEDG